MSSEETFHEIELRSEETKTPRPSSTSRVNNFFQSAFRKTFAKKKRRFTTPIAEADLLKNSISGPANVSEVVFSEEDFGFSRNSIQCCPFDISGYGAFLLMDEFKVQRPNKMVLMVFLFEKIIIFTKKQSPSEDSFYYIGSIKANQIELEPPNENKKLLELKDHLASKRFHRETIFSLEAPTEYIQQHWRKAIEKCLWSQFLQAKRDAKT
ncbi:unnamed protein product [Ceutorhynchus assimilis]|uniref:SOS1/NGEF-like PH domain-containing protein n=1 Tax=Ceutorhynchus assimilis TaxID=467358 RepID=A0A9N9QPQ0_9CUCU|nr:unnamed protein product [Ceutorhynchus assimilis]